MASHAGTGVYTMVKSASYQRLATETSFGDASKAGVGAAA